MKKNFSKIAAVAVATALAAGILAVPTTSSNLVKAVDASQTKAVDASNTSSTSTSAPAAATTTSTTASNVVSDAAVAKAVSEIEAAKATPGSTVVVGMSETTTTVPAGLILEAAGKDVNVKFDFGAYAWTVNGKSVTNAKNVNLEVKAANNVPTDKVAKLAGSNPTVQIALTENGDFGFTANLTYNVGAQYAGKYANLFWYKNDGTFEAISNSKIDPNGYSNLQFTHASNYVIVIADKALGESAATKANTATSTTTSPKTGETSSIF